MDYSQDEIIKEIQRIAHEKNVNLITLSEFTAATGVSRSRIYSSFGGGWREACKLAGLGANYQNIPISEDALFEEMHRVFLSYGRVCSRAKFGFNSKYNETTYRKRFGKWQNVLLAFRQWIESGKLEFPFMDQLPRESGKMSMLKEEHMGKGGSDIQHWPATQDMTYGSFINFRGLQHAPLNELGVVFLFGMICDKLGYVVEAIRSEYPDCEAKRCVDEKRAHWERVKVEFEYRSSSFKTHGHNPALCDVIVCWDHDWSECPIEVLELRSVVKSLTK